MKIPKDATIVNTEEEFREALENAKAGDEVYAMPFEFKDRSKKLNLDTTKVCEII